MKVSQNQRVPQSPLISFDFPIELLLVAGRDPLVAGKDPLVLRCSMCARVNKTPSIGDGHTSIPYDVYVTRTIGLMTIPLP